MSIDKLSYSKLVDFLSCPKKFELKHILKCDEFQQTIYTAFGNSIHSTIEEILKKDFDIDAGLCIYKREFAKNILNIPIKERQVIDSKQWYDKAVKILNYFYKKYFNKLRGNIVDVEKYFSYTINVEDKAIIFNGIADLLYKDGNNIKILDWKTGKKQSRDDTLQLRIYALILNKLFNYRFKEAAYIFIKEQSENKFDITPELLEQTEKELITLIKQIIDTKNFQRCFSNNCRFCSVKKFCLQNS